MKRLLWQTHRWLAVVFAIPFVVLVVTGLILSFEPIAQRSAAKPGSLTTDMVLRALAAEDPDGKAQSLAFRPYEGTLTIGLPAGRVTVDPSREPVARVEPGLASRLFGATRGLHEHLSVFGIELTIASTIAMMAVIGLGIALGLPRLRNSLGGWHKGTAWFLLPLVVLSPLSGLLLAWGVTLTPGAPPAPNPGAKPLPLAEAVRIVGSQHDLTNLIWLRQQRGRQLVRLWDGEEARVFALTREGLRAVPRNLPRAFHEGNFLGVWSGLMNVVISVAFCLLLVTGLWLIGRRELKMAARRKLAARTAA